MCKRQLTGIKIIIERKVKKKSTLKYLILNASGGTALLIPIDQIILYSQAVP
jgi:hypothetical protein